MVIVTANVLAINSARLPIGTFHAVGCRLLSSIEREGEHFYEMNRLDTADGRPLCEALFAEGMWLLAGPTVDPEPVP